MFEDSHCAQRLSLLLALLVALFSGCIQAQAGTREAMAEAMAKMMEAMGLLDSGPAAAMPMTPPFGSGWTPGFGMPGAAPWGMPMQDPSGAMDKGGEMMDQFARSMPVPGDSAASLPYPWMANRLDGVWEGRNGELLIVQGSRFRIYPGSAGYVDGYIQLRGDRLALYSPSDESARPFEFAESEGRLALRDAQGQLFLYRRLWLESEQKGAQSGSSSER